MGYPFVSKRPALTIVVRQPPQSIGNSPRLYVTPLPVIVPGSVPAAFIRTPPIALIKQNIHIDVRDHVGICTGYHYHVGRSSKPEGGEIALYIYVYPFSS